MAMIDKLEFSIDVIIPTYHSDEKLSRLLQMLCNQTIKPNRVILLHTQDYPGEEQPLPDVEELDITVVPIDKADFDHGGTRKYGASLSTSKILMFMTQDAVPYDKYLIEKLVEPYEDPLVAATYARQLADDKTDLMEGYIRNFNYPKHGRVKSLKDLDTLGIKTFFCSDVCATYRKAVYEKLGGFVDKTIFNEDMIMAAGMIRDGYRIAYTAEAMVIHSHSYSYLQQFTRNFDLGVSHNQYREVFQGIKSESEGIKMVKSTAEYLIKKKKYLLLPDLILNSGFKFIGYRLGRSYDSLPKQLVKHFSMNKAYWNKD
jgi:rhamnosyltransferase